MSLAYNTPTKQASRDETQSSSGGGRKTSTLKPPEQTLKCPRCDSPNTKFCYYNNYSLTQPRHFCKTCRRYWTKGGALRNVPIGGGCRKNKKMKSGSSRFINCDSSSKDSSLDIGGLSLFNGLPPPAMDFQLGGLNIPQRLNQFSSSYGENTSPYMNLDSLGFNFPLIKPDHQGGIPSFQEMGVNSNRHHSTSNNLASSIESLSSINQDLHWKLQQQRLATLFGGGESDQQQHQEQMGMENQAQKLQPILFQNLEISKPSQSSMAGDSRKDGGLETEWFFDNNYALMNVNPAVATASVNSNGSQGNYQNGSINNWNNGVQAWNHFNEYTSLP